MKKYKLKYPKKWLIISHGPKEDIYLSNQGHTFIGAVYERDKIPETHLYLRRGLIFYEAK